MLAFTLPAASWAQTLSETLPNGLKIIVKEDHRAPVAVSQIWYKIGSVDEKPGKSGLSHALEHMMFKGTKDVPSANSTAACPSWADKTMPIPTEMKRCITKTSPPPTCLRS